MAKEKKSFVLYSDMIHAVKELTKEEKGELLETILAYVNDENPTIENRIIRIAFEPIKLQLKRDLKKFEATKERKSDGGKKGMANRWKENITEHNIVKNIITPITDNVTVTDNVNDTVNANVNDIYIKDLENSVVFETIQRQTGLTKDFLKSQISLFIPRMKVHYKDFYEFADHFKSWVLKNKDNNPVKKYAKEL